MSSSWAEAARFSYPMTQGSPLTLSNCISSPDPILSGKSHWEAMCKSASSPHGPTNSSCSMNDLSCLLSSSIFETMPTVEFPQNTVTVAFKIFFFRVLFICFWQCWVFCCCVRSFSNCSEPGLPSGCSISASHCSGFSLQWPLTAVTSHCGGEPGFQGTQSSVVAACEFSSCGSQAP